MALDEIELTSVHGGAIRLIVERNVTGHEVVTDPDGIQWTQPVGLWLAARVEVDDRAAGWVRAWFEDIDAPGTRLFTVLEAPTDVRPLSGVIARAVFVPAVPFPESRLQPYMPWHSDDADRAVRAGRARLYTPRAARVADRLAWQDRPQRRKG